MLRWSLVVVLVVARSAYADHHVKVTDLQPFASGPLPGAPTIVIKAKASKSYCGGVALSAKVKKSKKLSPADKELAAVFAISFPKGLDFDPSHELAQKESTKKFDAWYGKFKAASIAAGARYFAIMRDTNAAPLDKVVAAARIVQVSRWSSQVIARGQIAKSVAKYPEAIDIYCQALEDKAEPLEAGAQDEAEHCRRLAAAANVEGWWDEVCAP
jgi:hypothetical protein